MRKNISQALELKINQVSIKAKTNEKMDSMGNGLSISTNAIVLVESI